MEDNICLTYCLIQECMKVDFYFIPKRKNKHPLSAKLTQWCHKKAVFYTCLCHLRSVDHASITQCEYRRCKDTLVTQTRNKSCFYVTFLQKLGWNAEIQLDEIKRKSTCHVFTFTLLIQKKLCFKTHLNSNIYHWHRQKYSYKFINPNSLRLSVFCWKENDEWKKTVGGSTVMMSSPDFKSMTSHSPTMCPEDASHGGHEVKSQQFCGFIRVHSVTSSRLVSCPIV